MRERNRARQAPTVGLSEQTNASCAQTIMSMDRLNSKPSPDEIQDCISYLQQGLLESESQETFSRRRRIILCPVCILVPASILTRASTFAPKEFPKQRFLIGCHCFLVDAMQVLTALPTPDDERKIWPDVRRTYNACHDESDRIDHSDEELLSYLLKSLKATVGVCLLFTTKTPTQRWSTRFGTKGAWPTYISDVLPGVSPRLAALNLLHYWSRHSEAPVSTTVLKAVLSQLPSIPDEISGALMEARQVFLPAYCERAATLGGKLQRLLVGSPEFGEARKNLNEFVGLSLAIVQVLLMAKILPHEFAASYEDQLNAAFDMAVRGESFLPTPLEITIASIHTMLLRDFHVSSTPDQLAANLRGMNAYSSLMRSGQDPYTRFYLSTMVSTRESRCWARKCQKYGEPGASKLMRCGRCRVLQYCSRECQRAHWKDEIRPHKSICSTLASIQDVYSLTTGETDSRAFSEACRGAGIQVEELVRPYWHFLALMMHDKSDAEGLESVLRLFFALLYLYGGS